jgi:predicted DNA-binding protein (UPF0251 family)
MRPKINKNLCCCPKTTVFTPGNVTRPDEVNLFCEEVEALDLKNNKGLDQVEAAKQMGISQSTFQRILASACNKMSDALVNGKTINIQKKSQNDID